MVDVKAKSAGKKKGGDAAKDGVPDPVVAGLIQFEKDARLVDIAAHELRQRHEDLWVGACHGELQVEKSLRTLLERFGAIGHREIPVSVMFVSADGQLKIII